MMPLLAQSGWSTTDSQNLQDLHDWTAQLFSTVGFDWGLGTGLTFGLAFVIVYALRAVFSDRDD
jgi:hypothetical protein